MVNLIIATMGRAGRQQGSSVCETSGRKADRATVETSHACGQDGVGTRSQVSPIRYASRATRDTTSKVTG